MAESASKPISVAKNESVVTVRLLGAVNTMTVKRFETGKDLVESVLKQYKKNHVKQTPRPDDIIGVLNVRTLRFLRLSSKAADQITSEKNTSSRTSGSFWWERALRTKLR